MRFVNKDAIKKDLQMFRYLYDENNEPTVKFTEKQMKAVCKFIEQYAEPDCILCDAEYWLNQYQIYTREWKFEDENREPQFSFIISRKPSVEMMNNSDNDINVDEKNEKVDIEAEEVQKEQLNEE